MSCSTLFKRHHFPRAPKAKVCLRCGYDSTCAVCKAAVTNGVCIRGCAQPIEAVDIDREGD